MSQTLLDFKNDYRIQIALHSIIQLQKTLLSPNYRQVNVTAHNIIVVSIVRR